MTNVPYILLTDIGSDIDDALALQCFLRSPILRLASVIVTHGVLDTRERLVRAMLGAENLILIAQGSDTAIYAEHPFETPFVTGFEGVALSQKDRKKPVLKLDGVDLLIRQVHELGAAIVSIAPLTTIARAFERDPSIIQKIPRIHILGGMLEGVEHNLVRDVAAAQIVFDSGVPLTIIPIDAIEPVPCSLLTRLKGGKSERMIATMAQAWKFRQEWELLKNVIHHADYEGAQELLEFFKSFTGRLPWDPRVDNEFFYLNTQVAAYSKALEHPDLSEWARARYEQVQTSFQIFLQLYSISMQFRDSHGFSREEFEKLDFSLRLLVNLGNSGLSGPHGAFGKVYRHIELHQMNVSDAYVPFILEYSQAVVRRPVSCSVTSRGSLDFSKGTRPHEIITSVDHEKFREFLKTRLVLHSPRRQRVRV